MKKNWFLVIIVLVLVVIAAYFVLSKRNSTLLSDISEFAIEDTSNITKIFLVNKESKQTLLSKKENKVWMINEKFKANSRKIEIFLETLHDLKIMAPVPKAMQNTVIKRLAANSVKVEIYQIKPLINIFNWIKLFPREKNTKTYFVGGPTKENIGTTMLMEGAETPYITHLPNFRGFLTPRFSAIEDDWRDHTVFSHPLEDIKSIKLEFGKEPEQSYEVNNLDNLNFDLRPLSSSEKLSDYDTLKLIRFVSAFENIKFEALLTNKKSKAFIDSVASSQPLHIITLIDNDNDTVQVKTFNKEGFAHLYLEDGAALEPFDLDRMYALVNDERDFVLIQFFVFDKILRPLSYFIEE